MEREAQHLEVLVTLDEEASVPEYASEGAAGADVRANISEEVLLLPGDSALIPTGLRFAVPNGYELQVRPRSGLALRHSVTVLNTPGTLDSDYRGELHVILINHGREVFVVTPKMRVAQVVVAAVERANFMECGELLETVRGEGGFGHTGMH